MINLFNTVINKILPLIRTIFNLVFGNWNYGAIFAWLPNDIRMAADVIILFLFGLALWKLLMHIIPH